MRTSFLPSTDNKLLSWTANFNELINATPTAYGLTAAQASEYTTLCNSFSTAMAACAPNIRCKTAVTYKNDCRTNLLVNTRLLASIIQGQAAVTDMQKVALGLNVRAMPTPIPPPSLPPGLNVVSVNGWTVKVRLYDFAVAGKRGKPAGVNGASIFSFAGTTPPTDLSQWKFECNTSTTSAQLEFASTLPPGTTVWLTAFWFNYRKQSGPLSSPICTNLRGGGVSTASVSLAA